MAEIAKNEIERIAVTLGCGGPLRWDGDFWRARNCYYGRRYLRVGGEIVGTVVWDLDSTTRPDYADAFFFSFRQHGLDMYYPGLRFTNEADARRACEEALIELLLAK